MKNNRMAKVGQVRVTKGSGSIYYTVVRLLGAEVEIMWIDGKLSGIKQIWSIHHLSDDTVVM